MYLRKLCFKDSAINIYIFFTTEIIKRITDIKLTVKHLIATNYDSAKIKHLHIIRREVVSPSQDCFPVLYSTWNRVRVAKVCVWISVTVGIVSNVDVKPSTKCWTITWILANCICWTRHHAFKWSKTFFVAEWKYERIVSGTISTTTGRWINIK